MLSALDSTELRALPLLFPATHGRDTTDPSRLSRGATSSLNSILASPPTGEIRENTDIIYGVLTLCQASTYMLYKR